MLVYGVCVQTADLLAAALAFPRVGGPALALELIKLRRTNGSLNAPQPINTVPVEVWDLIKQCVVDEEVQWARSGILDDEVCTDCIDRETKRVGDSLFESESETDLDGLEDHAWDVIEQRVEDLHWLRVWNVDWIGSANERGDDGCDSLVHLGADFNVVCWDAMADGVSYTACSNLGALC